MAFLILTKDKPGSGQIRADHRSCHYEFLSRHQHRIIASGGIQDDDGAFIGAAIALDVETQQQALNFVAEDPFQAAGLFASVEIVRWKPFLVGGRPFAPPAAGQQSQSTTEPLDTRNQER